MLDMLLGVFSSSGIGALIGLVGSWTTKKEERKNLEMNLIHEKEMYKLKSAQLREHNEYQLKSAEQNLSVTQVQAELTESLKYANAFETSQKTNIPLTNKFSEFIRGLMRPLITIYLLAIATLIAFHINGYMNGGVGMIQQGELVGMYQNMLDRVMFLTTTAVTWWFGSRPGSPKNATTKL